MNHALRVVALVAALGVALAACTPVDGGIGPQVTGNVEGYSGAEASVVVFAYPADFTATEVIEIGTGTVAGDRISFTLRPAPEAALVPVRGDDVEVSDPNARMALAYVQLTDQTGEFHLGKFASLEAPSPGDIGATLVYFDRPVTITGVGDQPGGLRGGSASLRQGWNVLAQTFTSIDEYGQPNLEVGNVDINALDWYFAARTPNPF